MSITDYYQDYWSSSGFHPSGPISSHLAKLYSTYIKAGSNVLEFGCGNASASAPWLRDHGCQYTGVDVSENAIREARKSGYNAHRLGENDELPFTDLNFDCVVCIDVLEHLFQPQLAAAKILKVLKAGGVLLATVPNVGYWRWRLQLAVLGHWNPRGDHLSSEQPWRDPHIRFFNTTSLQRMLLSIGFSSVRILGITAAGDPGELRGLRRFEWWVCETRAHRALEFAFPSVVSPGIAAVAYKPRPDCDNKFDNGTAST